MKEIYFCFSVNSSLDNVFQALAEKSGLAGWWTKNLDHTGKVGSISTFRFSSGAYNRMKIIKTEPGLIEWQCMDGHEEWKDTRITFELTESGSNTKVCFAHFGFREQTEYVGECSFHWAGYMISLQQFCETGKGMPDEAQIF
ncbi:MAG: SRPBCC domain-containing protein [Calditrichaceae bacterium]